jgi:four helix bundle protein
LTKIEGADVTEDKLKERTKNFAHFCVKLALSINSSILGKHLAKQLIRCSTSVAANYSSACIAHSKASFIAKIKYSFRRNRRVWLLA